jgi:hypothetical protein
MANIEIAPLADRLGDDEISELARALTKIGAPKLPEDDDGATTLAANLDDEVLAEFLDRLEVYDMACEIYLPGEFEGRVEVADKRVGSAPALLEVLEELRDELSLEDDEEEEEGDDDEEDEEEEEDDEDDYGKGDMQLIDEQIRRLWKIIYEGAQAAIDRNLALYVRSA